jgi:NAD(P)H-flavin reductase
MFRFVIDDLNSMGLPDEDIVSTLERYMKCGVGKCGHCQMNNIYVCQEGPVFNYDKIKDLKEAIR